MVGRGILCLLESRKVYIGILWMVSVGFIKVYEIGRRYIVPAVLRNFSRSVVLNGVELGIS